MSSKKPGVIRYFMGGLLCGAIAAVLNLIWLFSFEPITGNVPSSLIHMTGVVLASLIMPTAAGILFWFLVRKTKRGKLAFYALSVIVVIGTAIPPMLPVLPDGNPTPGGFALLTLPMHFIAFGVTVILLPWYVSHKRNRD